MSFAAEQEVFFTCPYCWERISMIFDASAGGQEYIEDCEVCCRPIRVRFRVQPDGSVTATAYQSGG
jgi:hypothetical protein